MSKLAPEHGGADRAAPRPDIGLLMVMAWLAGVVLAKGFWSTACAVWMPPWAWYLVMERVLQLLGVAS